MKLYDSKYIELLKSPEFFLLFLTTFLGQVASAFLVLSMIVSVYARTESSYAVSGVILSFTIPGFFLMAFAGIAADVIDRRKIILFANLFISIVVFVILFFQGRVIATTLLTTLYFVGNTFYLPAAQAATGQIAGRKRIFISNVYFVFTFVGGLIFGFFVTSIVHFFLGVDAALWICFCILATAAVSSYFLPSMVPKKRKEFSFFATTKDVIRTFLYIFRRKLVWFYFVIFASAQAVIAFAATIAPGFFKEVLGLSLDRALVLVFPLVGAGAVAGGMVVNFLRRREPFFIILGLLLLSAAFLFLGGFLKFDGRDRFLVYLVVGLFLVCVGFADLIIFLTSRVAIQKNVDHNYQGTVFGASIILTSVMASLLSLTAAKTVGALGYVNTLFFSGVGLLLGTVVVFFLVWKWLS